MAVARGRAPRSSEFGSRGYWTFDWSWYVDGAWWRAYYCGAEGAVVPHMETSDLAIDPITIAP
eukprot:7045633-Prymnesium_polylepis.1